MRKLLPILLLAVLPRAMVAQQVSVVASVDESTIGTEETVTYTIQVSGTSASSIQTPSPPRAEGLSLMQSVPSTQSNISIVNGVMEQSYGFRWSYRPLTEGSARIASTTVTVAGNTYQTNAIDISVVPQSQRPNRAAAQTGRRLDPFSSLFRSPFDVEEPLDDSAPDPSALFIRATASARQVVQNEQVTIEYQLFFREGIQLRQSRLTDSWDAEGFWREELAVETRPIPRIVVENGLRYNTIILKRAAVFPTRAGTLIVDSLRIESEAVLPSPSADPLRLFSLRNRFRPVKISSPSISIESLALPENAPSSFTGAVGEYDLDVRIDRTTLDVGASVQVSVTISGIGNLATLEAPSFVPPAAFELYDPRIETNLDRSGYRLSGSKTFTYVMVPRSNGTFVLPGIEFSHYDPSAGLFRTENSNPVEILVTGTASIPDVVVATTNGLPVDDVAKPIEDAGRWVRLSKPSLHTSLWPYVVLLLPLLVLGIATIYQHHQSRMLSDMGYARSRKAHPLAKKHLRRAKSLLETDETVLYFGELERAILGFIGNRLNISEKGLTRQQLDGEVMRAGIDDGIRGRLKALLELCDRGRFVPGTFERSDLMDAYEEAASLIVLTDGALADTE